MMSHGMAFCRMCAASSPATGEDGNVHGAAGAGADAAPVRAVAAGRGVPADRRRAGVRLRVPLHLAAAPLPSCARLAVLMGPVQPQRTPSLSTIAGRGISRTSSWAGRHGQVGLPPVQQPVPPPAAMGTTSSAGVIAAARRAVAAAARSGA